MKYSVFILFALLVSCSTEKGNFITGTLENGAGQTIYFNQIANNNIEKVDSVVVGEDGSFKMPNRAKDFNFYTMSFPDGNMIVLLTDSTENITFKGSTEDILNNYEVMGSKHSEVLRNYYAGAADYREQLDSIQKAVQAFGQNFADPRREAMVAGFETIRGNYQTYQIDFIEKNSFSPACLSILSELDPMENLESFKKVHAGIADIFSTHFYYNMLTNQINDTEKKLEIAAKLGPGGEAPEIELTSPDGKLIALSSLRGKVVLIDFWASWCKPCRIENPNVVKMYNQYSKKGFEIYGVSLDKDKDAWVKAIKEDGLTWPHVSDLQFWNSAAAKLYNVSSIPHTVLVDRDGKIIATGLRGPALESKLAEILSM
jgi:peroxiredoxin